MKVLVACEESQEVCKAFRAKGHEAYSCDLIEPSGGHPEWHILAATWCPSGSYSHKHGEQHKGMFSTDRARNRAKTFPGVAKAMSEQWG